MRYFIVDELYHVTCNTADTFLEKKKEVFSLKGNVEKWQL